MYTDVDADRKNKAVRLTEKALLAIQPELPEGFQIPQIAVVDFQKHRLNPSENKIAIAGYDKITNTMYVNNIYDSSEKVLEYVNRLPGWFANTTEQAPFLHELGHKFYEDCIKRLAISEDIGYNESKKKIDRRIFNHIEEQHDSDFIRKFLSVYADKGWTSGEFTEIIAECFSVRGKNSVADAILALLGWWFMMLLPTNEEYELYKKLDQTTDKKEREKILERLKEIAIQQKEALKDCPFAH